MIFVIRTNGAFPVDPKYHSDYGKKCNVLYTNQLYERKTRMNPKEFEKLGLNFIVLKSDFHATQYRFKTSRVMTRLATTDFIKAQRSLGLPLLMGTFIIHDVLMCNPSELYLTGLTLYSNGPEYVDDYLPQGAKIEELEVTRKKMHKQDAQNRYWKERFKLGEFKADEDLTKILESI